MDEWMNVYDHDLADNNDDDIYKSIMMMTMMMRNGR